MPVVPARSASSPLVDCVAVFDAQLRELAWALAEDILAREFQLAGAAASATKRPRGRGHVPTQQGAKRRRASAKQANAQMALVLEPAAAPAAASASPSSAAEAATDPQVPIEAIQAQDVEPAPRSWSRERVITELAKWLLEEPGIDAATLNRRGQASLANWAKRIFGRFDAALNAANIHLAELYPDGPPSRGVRRASAT